MDRQLIAFRTSDNSEVVIETAPSTDQLGITPVARADGVVAVASDTLESAIARIAPLVSTVRQSLGAMTDVSEFSCSAGIKLSASAGAIIAATETEAHFVITVKWNPG